MWGRPFLPHVNCIKITLKIFALHIYFLRFMYVCVAYFRSAPIHIFYTESESVLFKFAYLALKCDLTTLLEGNVMYFVYTVADLSSQTFLV